MRGSVKGSKERQNSTFEFTQQQVTQVEEKGQLMAGERKVS
jgi:hypothetical protein